MKTFKLASGETVVPILSFFISLVAIITTLMTLAAFAIMNYMKLPATYFCTHILQFIVSSVIFATVLSVLLYIKSRNAPQYARSVEGNTGMFLSGYAKF